jgi:class 3 adenylate cyclase/tetratricopeptide (TPR) repeat protein
VTNSAQSADVRLSRLLERLLNAAEASLAAGDLEPARATAEEVAAVDPDNPRAAQILERIAARSRNPMGERALMTLLFSDLVGSTRLSEQVQPEQLRDLFSYYRATAREAVHRYSGHLVQFSGDGILASFGYPDPHEDDARRAVLAGLDLVTAMRDARPELQRRLGAALEVRVGIHTGRVVITDLGDDRYVAERDSIVGLVPNLAARIQQAAEPDMVVISDVTQQLVDVDFYMRSLGEQELKGISRPVEVFAVQRPRYAAARFESDRYRKAGLVGREAPREQLLSAWEAVQQPDTSAPCTSFLVVGEAGIGKSRLAAEVLDRVQASGGQVIGMGCLPYYANVSLWPLRRMLDRILAVVSDGDDRLPALLTHLRSLDLDPARFIPFVGPLAGVPDDPAYPAPQLDPSAFLEETLGRLVEWLSALAARTPHLFVVEDLHWADPSTLGLLGRLVERRLDAVLTVATTRDDAGIPWKDAVCTVRLSRLDQAAAAQLVDNLSAGEHLSVEQRASIVEQAEGNPLFVEELTRSSLAADPNEPLPMRLQELLTWRFKTPGVDLRVVQVAATVGPTFDAATVSSVVGDQDSVDRQLRVLTEAGIIGPGDPSTNTYRFRHALLRDAAYETQVLDVRRETHAAVAEAIAERGGQPALVAQHLDLAGSAERAAGLYVVAAQAEQGRGAHPEATKLLSRALDLLETLPESDARDLTELTARMLRGLSVSYLQGYAAHDVQADHRRAEVLATSLGTRPEVLPSLIAIWSYWLVSGELATARGLIERLTDMVGQTAFAWFAPEVESCAGWQEIYEGHLELGREHQERAMAGFGARPEAETVSPFWPLPNDPVAVVAVALACIAAVRGEPALADHWVQEGLRRAEAIGFPRGPFSLAFVKTYAAWIRRIQGDYAAAQRLGAEVVAIGAEHGYAYWTALGSAYLATSTPGGPPDRVFLEQVVVGLRLMGQEAFAPANIGYLAELTASSGDVDRAHELVSEAVELVHKTGEFLHLPELLRARAEYTLARGGDAEDAVADLTEAVRVATEQGARVARLRAALALSQLPESFRPPGWRGALSEARTDMPASLETEETAAADALLAD